MLGDGLFGELEEEPATARRGWRIGQTLADPEHGEPSVEVDVEQVGHAARGCHVTDRASAQLRPLVLGLGL